MKHTIAFFLFLFLGSTNSTIWANSFFSEEEARTLIQAKTHYELNHRRNLLEVLHTMFLACRLEVGENRIPYACYDYKKNVSRYEKMYGRILPGTSQLNDLTRHCLKAVSQYKGTELRRNRRLDLVCEQSLRRKVEINRYKNDDESKDWQGN